MGLFEQDVALSLLVGFMVGVGVGYLLCCFLGDRECAR